MKADAFYELEQAGDFFRQLKAVAEGTAPVMKRYRMVAKIFTRLINNATSNNSVLLVGPFAKTDYLLNIHGADENLRFIVNDARSRFHNPEEIAERDLPRVLAADLAATAQFAALIFNCKVPNALAALFPKFRLQKKFGKLAADYMRLIVSDTDENYFFGYSPDQAGKILRVAFASDTDPDADFSYLRQLIHPGSQLNLIRPRCTGGVFRPELIIYEPDFLTDVSAIASCFESYGTDPRIVVLKRLMPAPEGNAINMGNFAGQLLDEVIHNECNSYSESAKRFFRKNALTLAAFPPGPDFHTEAKAQIQHIRNAVDRQLPAEVSGFDRKQLMVEPTFFSEMLGLQGRMDFLQLDLKVIAEQKSGKGEWPCGDFSRPRQREPHYVQLLLYMAIIRYNYHARYKENKKELHAFLMYSKYSQSLLGLGFAPKLLRKAFEIRNHIVANELRFAEEGFGFLSKLDPEELNTVGQTTLWTRYTLPSLNRLLRPIQDASALERAYFLRFMRFVAREHILSKVGNQQKEGSGFAATWHDSLEEKLDAGNIYIGLELNYNFTSDGKIESLQLNFTDDEACDMANFRRGDIVILYPYDCHRLPDARRNMVFRCTIEDIADDSIMLRLRSPQSGSAPFDMHRGRLWAIEHDFIESSYSSLYRGLHSFLCASKRRRDLILFQRRPEADDSVTLSNDYGSFTPLMRRVAAARDFFLIIGPPGTGKTSYGMLNTVREELTRQDSNILVLAYTNRAVDEICDKLSQNSIEYIRLGNELACAGNFRDSLLHNKVKECSNAATLLMEIRRHRVFVATTTAINAANALFALKHFSLAVIDEASQILEPQLSGILAAAHNGKEAIDKFVFIGDHKQLPAIVQQTPSESMVEEECLKEIGLHDCRLSFFERLATRYASDPSVCHMLDHQGRMHRDIADFASRYFYGGLLHEVPLPHQTADLPTPANDSPAGIIGSHRMLFFNVETADEALTDKVNRSEAKLIARLLKTIYDKEGSGFDPDDTAGVIVPYRNQIAAIRSELEAIGAHKLTRISIDTVERYQGSQRKYIIYGFTIQKYYQLQFLTSHVFEENGAIIDRKLNVALTRAREHMIVLGNETLLRRNLTFSRLIEHIKEHGGYFNGNILLGEQ